LVKGVKRAAEDTVPRERRTIRGDTVSQGTLNLLETRGKRRAEGNF
jgi:hypothetical protein